MLLAFVLLASTASFGQKKQFLDQFGKKCKEKVATYYRIVVPEGNSFLVKDYYNHNNKLQMEGHYRSKKCEWDTREGIFTYYFENGEKSAEGEFLTGKYHGKWTYWFASGQVKSEGTYDKSNKEGKWVYYHRNGNVKVELLYKDGSVDGAYNSTFDNGDKEEETNFQKGKLHGDFVVYYRNSGNKIKFKGSYMKDSLDGPYEGYWRNGTLSYKGEYSDNKREGTWEYFHSNGNKSAEVEFKKGKFIKAVYFDEDGKKLSKKVTFDDLYKSPDYPGGSEKMYKQISDVLVEKADVAGAAKVKYSFFAKIRLTVDEEGNITHVEWLNPDDDDDDYIDPYDFYKFVRSAIEDFPKFEPAKAYNRKIEETYTFIVSYKFGK